MRYAAWCAAAFLVLSCTNVAQMQRQYEAGDHSQFEKLAQIAARPEYPYGTRRKAARALGEIGDPRAVPVLTNLLFEPAQRMTLREEALLALGRVGDRRATESIGLMLDMQLQENDAQVRMTALETLGSLGGAEAAEILVNAMRYYDVMLWREQQRTNRGVFSGQEKEYPYGYGRTPHEQDTTSTGLPGGPRMGMYRPDETARPVSMFGTQMDMRYERMPNTYEEEYELARQALQQVGEPAVPVMDAFLRENETTQSLQRALAEVALAIRQETDPEGAAAVSPAGADSVEPAPEQAAGGHRDTAAVRATEAAPADSAGESGKH